MAGFQPSVAALAQLATKRGVLLAAVLEGYQLQHQLSDEALAHCLGITQEQLARLKLCEVPRDAQFAEDVSQIAAHIAVNAAKLTRVLRA